MPNHRQLNDNWEETWSEISNGRKEEEATSAKKMEGCTYNLVCFVHLMNRGKSANIIKVLLNYGEV